MSKINNILVPLPISEGGKIALRQAEYFHKVFNMDITVLHVIPETSFFKRTFKSRDEEKLKEATCQQLSEFLSDFYEGEIPEHVKYIVLSGDLVDTIVNYSQKKDYDLIIIRKAARKSSRLGLFNQNDSDKVIARSVCPVITINEDSDDPVIRTIMLPVDIMQRSERKVSWAMYLAKKFNAKVIVVTALNMPVAKTNSLACQKASAIQEQFSKNNVECEIDIVETFDKKHYEAVLEEIEKRSPDLVVIMTRKEVFSFDKKIGTFATEIIHESKSPIFSFVPEPDTVFNNLVKIMQSD